VSNASRDNIIILKPTFQGRQDHPQGFDSPLARDDQAIVLGLLIGFARDLSCLDEPLHMLKVDMAVLQYRNEYRL